MRGLRPASALAMLLAAAFVACAGAGSREVTASAPGARPAPAVSAPSGAPRAAPIVAVRLAPALARLPELAERLSAGGEPVQVVGGAGELPLLDELLDDARAVAVYSAQSPGVVLTGSPDRAQLVARLAASAHGGEVPNPPPLAAIRVAVLRGLDVSQLVAMAELVVSTTLVEEQSREVDAQASARLAAALARATLVADDRRASQDCRAPCQPWPWSTQWSVLTALARAQWRAGSRLGDASLLAQSEQLARRALSVVPAAHPLTVAVSERLLGAVLQASAVRSGDDAAFAESRAANQRALAGFRDERQRYDWALTQKNLQATLQSRLALSSSPAAATEALAASDQVLSVIDQRTPKLRAQALLERAQLLRSQWARSGEQRQLTEAVGVLQDAAALVGAAAPSLDTTLALARCDLESELGGALSDVARLKQAVAGCEAVRSRPSLRDSTAAEALHGYGLALARLALALGDNEMLGRAVDQLAAALEAFDRIEGVRASVKVRADYAWGVLELSRMSSSTELARKAVSVSGETLGSISKQANPLQWSQLKQAHGVALLLLGWSERAAFQLASAAELYQQARAAFMDALGGFSKDDNPRRWGELQRWLGQTYMRESESALDPRQRLTRFNQALASFQLALSVSGREVDPDAFARTQLGLGSTYLVRADNAGLKEARESARRAEAAFRQALAVFEQVGQVASIANAKAHLADALDVLQRTAGGSPCEAVRLRLEAVSAYPDARGLWTPAKMDLDNIERSRFARSRCPELPESFWQSPPKAQKKP